MFYLMPVSRVPFDGWLEYAFNPGVATPAIRRAIALLFFEQALNNSYHLFLIPSPLDEKRFTRINITTAISHAESEYFARKRYCREELRTLIAA